jgi:hypothetical protein
MKKILTKSIDKIARDFRYREKNHKANSSDRAFDRNIDGRDFAIPSAASPD